MNQIARIHAVLFLSRIAFSAPVRCVGLMLAMTLAAVSPASAEDWPQWRGPTNNGLSGETGIPTHWSDSENVAWKTPLPGPAGASPVVAGGRIFLTSVNDANELLLQAYATQDGKLAWSKVISVGNQTARGDEGNSASPSPVTDGKHVWCFMGDGTLTCFTADGTEVWRVAVQDRYGKFSIQFGMTSSPVLDQGVLYLQLIHGEGDPSTQEARVVALDALTGQEKWQVTRESDGYAENEHSYASPIIYEDGQRRFLITHGNDYTIAHRLNDGSEIWRCGDLNLKSSYDETLRFVASPVAVPGLIVIPTAKGAPVVAIKPNGSGNITKQPEFQLWRYAKTPDVPSPIIVGDLVYLCMQDGDLAALEATTGKQVYFARTHRQRHRASPVYADGHLYLCARDGQVTVVKTGPKFEVVAENQLGEDISSSPAISGKTLYLRGFNHLWAIRASK